MNKDTLYPAGVLGLITVIGLGGMAGSNHAATQTENQLRQFPTYIPYKDLGEAISAFHELHDSLTYTPPGLECVRSVPLRGCLEARGVPAQYPNGVRARQILEEIEQRIATESILTEHVRLIREQVPEEPKIINFEGQPIEINGMDTVREQVRRLNEQAVSRRSQLRETLPENDLSRLFSLRVVNGLSGLAAGIGILGLNLTALRFAARRVTE